MNRKSFYYHFKDKYDLVNWIYYTEFIDRMKTKTYTASWDVIDDLCEYLFDNKEFYQKNPSDGRTELLFRLPEGYSHRVFYGRS